MWNILFWFDVSIYWLIGNLLQIAGFVYEFILKCMLKVYVHAMQSLFYAYNFIDNGTGSPLVT